MLDGCGIETRRRTTSSTTGRASRSMLDGCGIETIDIGDTSSILRYVAIDARWLWDRDFLTPIRLPGPDGSRSMLDGCGIRDHPRQADAYGRAGGRDRCSMAVGSRRSFGQVRSFRTACRDRCSMAVGSRRERTFGGSLSVAGRDRCSMAVRFETRTRATSSASPNASRLMLDDWWDRDSCSAQTLYSV